MMSAPQTRPALPRPDQEPATVTALQQEERAFLLKRFKQTKDIAFKLEEQHWFLQEYVKAVKSATDAKPQTLITPLLSALAANVGNRVFIRSGFRKHYANIWSIIIGPSTIGRKSTALHLASAPLKVVNNALREAYEQELEIYDLYSDEEKRGLKMPARKFVIYPSCPSEQFLSIVGQNPVGLLMYSEIADFLTKMNKSYSADFKSMITAMFDGDGAERATRSFGVEGVEKPAFSIATATTREWFLKELDKEHDVNSGFLQRFLICNAYDIDFNDLQFGFRAGDASTDWINTRLTAVCAQLRAIGTEQHPQEITLTEHVKQIYASEYKAALKPYFDDEDSRMYSYVGRLFEDYFFRFCLLFCLLDHIDGRALPDDWQVDAEHAVAAHRLCKFYLGNVEGFLKDDVSATQEERNEQMIIRHLRKRKVRTGLDICPHSILKNLTHLSKMDFENTIASLVNDNVIDVLKRKGDNNKNALYYKLILSDEPVKNDHFATAANEIENDVRARESKKSA
jgi:hypothetical protein